MGVLAGSWAHVSLLRSLRSIERHDLPPSENIIHSKEESDGVKILPNCVMKYHKFCSFHKREMSKSQGRAWVSAAKDIYDPICYLQW